MNVHQTSLHLDGHEAVEVTPGSNHDTIAIGLPLDAVRLVLGHDLDPDVRAAFLRKLAEAASDLADEIVLRDLEAAS